MSTRARAGCRPAQYDLFGNPIEDRGRARPGRDIIKLDFEDRRVRVVIKDGEPWWVASDLARVLGYRDASNATRLLAEDEKGAHKVSTPSGQQEMTVVSESGLYRLIMNSRRPEAEDFRRWVFRDVLPQIRKTGGYNLGRTARIARRNKCDLDTAKVRGDQIDANTRSHSRLHESGAGPRQYADWHNGGYRGQFERTAGELREALGVPSHVSPLDRMEQLPLQCNLHAKILAERIIAERAKDGDPIPLADQPALLERLARKMSRSDLNRLGDGYIYGMVEHDRRGLVIDVVKALPSAG